jgi:hypothetical protein
MAEDQPIMYRNPDTLIDEERKKAADLKVAEPEEDFDDHRGIIIGVLVGLAIFGGLWLAASDFIAPKKEPASPSLESPGRTPASGERAPASGDRAPPSDRGPVDRGAPAGSGTNDSAPGRDRAPGTPR